MLVKSGIKAMQVSEITKFSEMMDGRVKTLHPLIHGGILADRKNPKHLEEAKNAGISFFDIVCVNLYPFEEVVAKEEVSLEEAIENIDIGGPSMIRSAAKNHAFVTVITDTNDYLKVLDELQEKGEVSQNIRAHLALKAFERTYRYDEAIADYFRKILHEPELMNLHYVKAQSLRYGENPHQKAAFFRNPENHDSNITNAQVLAGKQLSFNNIVDADAALELVKEFDRPSAVFVKHNNPCGVASADTIELAFKHGHQVDPMAAFGCVIALNKPCTKEICDYINEQKLFVEIIVAPDFTPEALECLQSKANLRLLKTGDLKLDEDRRDIKKVAGGILIQSADTYIVTEKDLRVVTGVKPNEKQIQAMLFARKVVKHVKSNAVVFANILDDGSEVVTAVGAGQMSRVDAVIIAKHKGGERIKGSVMASDAFFPFADGVEQAYEAGASAIIQPGGSIRDEEVIAKANELNLAMVFTGVRSFRH
jgi:phosphoribosylaminoimidazolecarboxamide formyltransferase/IMP cyclohydrolase